MFRRLINTNIKTIGVRRLSNNNNNNNHRIVEELEKINSSLQAIAIALIGTNLIIGFKR